MTQRGRVAPEVLSRLNGTAISRAAFKLSRDDPLRGKALALNKIEWDSFFEGLYRNKKMMAEGVGHHFGSP